MGIATQTSSKIFAVIALVFQLWFILMYALIYRYVDQQPSGPAADSANFQDINGYIIVTALLILFLIGFTLVNTYVVSSAYSTMILSFVVLVFSVQYYFIVRSFWVGVGLGHDDYGNTLGGQFKMLRLISSDYRLSGAVTQSYNANTGFAQAIVCALSMLVAYMSSSGRIGGLQIFILCFIGQFFYCFNEIIFWRHVIGDNGFTIRLFLFGSTMGLVSSFILSRRDKQATANNEKFVGHRYSQTFALLGTVFVWILLPFLSSVNMIYGTISTSTYLQPATLNTWFALSASASVTFAITILLGKKISVHDVVFSSFSGAIAFGASSNFMSHPFPAMLIGTIVGVITTLLNHFIKKPINNGGVVDTQGTFITFFIPAFLGGIYSAIIQAVRAYGAEDSTFTSINSTKWVAGTRTSYEQGGFQILGVLITIGIATFAGIVIGLLLMVTSGLDSNQVFNDETFVDKNEENTLRKSKIIQNNPAI